MEGNRKIRHATSVQDEVIWGRQYRIKRNEALMKPLSPVPYPTDDIKEIEATDKAWRNIVMNGGLKEPIIPVINNITHLGKKNQPPSGQYIHNILKSRKPLQMSYSKEVKILKGPSAVAAHP